MYSTAVAVHYKWFLSFLTRPACRMYAFRVPCAFLDVPKTTWRGECRNQQASNASDTRKRGVVSYEAARGSVAKVLGGLGRTSHVLRRIGLPLTVHWTHLETTCAESSWSITLGSCFHFQISLDDEPRVIVSSLPGLENPALHRRVELPSAVAFHHFLLGEICRQIVLTFGDIASARMKRVNREGCRFEVQLIPPAMHLSTEVAAASRTTRAVDYARLEGEGGAEDATHRGRCEVRVFADEVGVHISCTALPKSSGPLYGRGNMGKLLLDNNRYTDDVFDIIEGGLSTERWEGLDGSDVFSKFSSLLALVYPLKQQQPT